LGDLARNVLTESPVIGTSKETSDSKFSSRSLSEKIEELLVNDRIKTREEPIREIPSDDMLKDLCPFIAEGSVIPIISNGFRIEQIFGHEMGFPNAPADEYEELTVSRQLTQAWADIINYPYSDTHDLAQVAQYYLVQRQDAELAKAEYISFLKNALLSLSEQDETYKESVSSLRRRAHETHFSEAIQLLDYPRFPETKDDPLRLLARLPLPIYITTSYFDFLERALTAEGKMPRTQLCFWHGRSPYIKREYLPDHDYVPTVNNPAVYHLFGLEDSPNSLVLSQDDYMNFLVSMADDIHSQDLLPASLRGSLNESRLILLGFRQNEWDFRVLFKFLMMFRKDPYIPPGIINQPKPTKKSIQNEENSLVYQMKYFRDAKFRIEWDDTDNFVQRISNEWEEYRLG
jgi:hypothetical protein